jgi:hypothetical protein
MPASGGRAQRPPRSSLLLILLLASTSFLASSSLPSRASTSFIAFALPLPAPAPPLLLLLLLLLRGQHGPGGVRCPQFFPWDGKSPVSHPTCDVSFPQRRTGRYWKGMILARPSYQGFRRSVWDPETFAPGRRHAPRGAPSPGAAG